MTDRQWTDTDLALILPHMHAPDLDDDTDRQERAAAVLDALTAAGWRPPAEPSAAMPALRAQVREDILAAEVDRLRARVAELETTLADGTASDGYHTHNELYQYRLLYHAHAAAGWLAAGIPVVKSWRHHDGEECFGGGWFIVTAQLPTGQVSNHYEAQHWDLFAVPAVDLPPAWDGHTPADAAERLNAALSAAPPETAGGGQQ